MKTAPFFSAFAAVAAAQESAPVFRGSNQIESNIVPLILGGTVVPAGQKTYVSGIRDTASGSTFCGGSLITPKHILTAAHCAVGIKYVSVGTHFVSGAPDGEQIKVVKSTIHPKNDKDNQSYDFLILELEKPSKFTPVALSCSEADLAYGKTSTVIGWGTTTEGGSQSKELLQVDVPFLSNNECSKKLTVDDSMVCAGGLQNKDSCQGDSGGPLVVNKSGQDALVGVVSWGEGCGRAGYPGVYGRVAAAKDFIDMNAPGAKWI